MSELKEQLNFTVGIVIFNNGPFGGAPRRYTNLFLHLNNLFPGKVYYFINNHLFSQLKEIYNDIPWKYIRIVDSNKRKATEPLYSRKNPAYYNGIIPNPDEIDRNAILARKIYWYLKNWIKQYRLYRQIEKYRKQLGIKVFLGVFSGILPLVFYLKSRKRKAAVIFSDMDSWFSEVHTDMKKLWYRKYYSFNFALENSDIVDFLSSYVVEGVKKRGVNLRAESIHIAPCSFIDYTNCIIGDKSKFEIAFCARLEPEKNPIMYLEAANEILIKYPDIKFHLLGEGSLVNEINDFITSNHLQRSINFQFHKRPAEILKNTSVFVSIQSNTNYPSQSVLEAMACGNAIIASDVGDTRMFINNNNGVLIALETKALINALEKLIIDKNLTLTLGTNAACIALNNHSLDMYSDYFLSIINKAYKQVLNILKP